MTWCIPCQLPSWQYPPKSRQRLAKTHQPSCSNCRKHLLSISYSFYFHTLPPFSPPSLFHSPFPPSLLPFPPTWRLLHVPKTLLPASAKVKHISKLQFPSPSLPPPFPSLPPHSLVCQHEGDGAIESHRIVQLILKHVQVVQPVRIPTTVTIKQ